MQNFPRITLGLVKLNLENTPQFMSGPSLLTVTLHFIHIHKDSNNNGLMFGPMGMAIAYIYLLTIPILIL